MKEKKDNQEDKKINMKNDRKEKKDDSKRNNAWELRAKDLAKKPEDEIEALLNRDELGKNEEVAFLRKRIPELRAERAMKASRKVKKTPRETVNTVVIAEKPEQEFPAAEIKASPAITEGLTEVKELLGECEEIQVRLNEDKKKPAPTVKTEEKKESPATSSLKDRKPGDVLWEWRPNMSKKESNEEKAAPLGVIVIRKDRKKIRQLPSSAKNEPAEKIQPVTEEVSGNVEEPIFYTFDSVLGKAPDRSFLKELSNGNAVIGKRYKIEDEDGNIKRFRVLIPGNVLGRECKQFPAKENRPPYTWRTIFVSGTTLRVNLNLRRSKDGSVLEPSPNENGDIIGEAEIGYNVSMKNGKIYAIQYMNVYAPNGATGDMYQVYANLSRGERIPGDVSVGPSIGTYLKSKQDEKTADAEIILHLKKLPE